MHPTSITLAPHVKKRYFDPYHHKPINGMQKKTDHKSLELWLHIAASPNLGPQLLRQLLHYCDYQLQDCYRMLLAPQSSKLPPAIALKLQACLKKIKHNPTVAIQKSLTWQQQPQHHILTWDNPLFPRYLHQITTPPILLYVIGNPYCLSSQQIAVVGSRKSSISALEMSHAWSLQLATHGYTITSGLALGVDAAAHRGALAGNGNSIAVLGCGLQQIYPKQHTTLATTLVAKGGAIVSEYPLDAPPRAFHFPQRNRLISGLSLGTLVVEAGLKSGSLITARYALEQNRELMVIPTSPGNASTCGGLQLIQQGAHTVCTASEVYKIIHALPKPNWLQTIAHKDDTTSTAVPGSTATPASTATPGSTATPRSTTSSQLCPHSRRLLACFDIHNCTSELLLQRSGLTVKQFHVSLHELLQNDCIRAINGGYIKNLPQKRSTKEQYGPTKQPDFKDSDVYL